MWENSDGRRTVQTGDDAQSAYAVGDAVIYHRDANVIGTVVHVSTVISPLISVVWDGNDGEPIIYPMNTTLLRRAWPWEIEEGS
jgi:hypothetical protein